MAIYLYSSIRLHDVLLKGREHFYRENRVNICREHSGILRGVSWQRVMKQLNM